MATTQQFFIKIILIICDLHARSNTVNFHFEDGFDFQNQTVYGSLSTRRVISLTMNRSTLFVRILHFKILRGNNGRRRF